MPSHALAPALPLRLLAAVWLPFGFAYALSLFFRSVNAVLSPDLVRDLGLDPSELGVLTSAYMLAFAAFQLPLGLLLDRYGPRLVNGSLLVIAALGSLMFALAESLVWLMVARALIGLGVSGCLMAAIQAFIHWFPRSVLASLYGWVMAAGGLGALAATVPVEMVLQHFPWRTLFYWLAGITLISAALTFWAVPDPPDKAARESLGELVRGLLIIGRDTVFWKIGLLQAVAGGTSMALLGLWLAPWLRDVAGMTRGGIGVMLAVMAASMTFGFALWGMAADRLARRGVKMITLYLGGLATAIVMLGLLAAGITTGLPAIVFTFSFFGASGQLMYAILARRFPVHLAGRCTTATNMLMFSAAFAIQWGMGAVIGLWPSEPERYAIEGYRMAFGIVFGVQAGLYLIVFMARRRIK